MKSLWVICLTAFGAVTFFGCSPRAANTDVPIPQANANTATAAPPTVEALKALEATAFDAYKNKDTNFFHGFLTDKFVESANGRRLDKAAAIKMIGEHKCDITGFSFSDEKLTNVGAATAIITMKATADGRCDGAKIPPFVSASLYVLDGTKWKGDWSSDVCSSDLGVERQILLPRGEGGRGPVEFGPVGILQHDFPKPDYRRSPHLRRLAREPRKLFEQSKSVVATFLVLHRV